MLTFYPLLSTLKLANVGKKWAFITSRAIMWFAKAYKFVYSHLITFHQVGQIAVMPI